MLFLVFFLFALFIDALYAFQNADIKTGLLRLKYGVSPCKVIGFYSRDCYSWLLFRIIP